METVNFRHVSVLLDECIEALNIRDGYTYVDCTTGGGGHSLEIAKRLGEGSRLICIDRDTTALAAAKERLSEYIDKVTFVHSNYSDIDEVLNDLKIDNLGGVLADLGCSSYQFDTPERGFSYMHDAPLDMRMDEGAVLSAYTVINTYSESELKRIIYEYGEERFAPKIAKNIVISREKSPIRTTGELVEIIKASMPGSVKNEGSHPAKRTFQAIRIEVNSELTGIPPMLRGAVKHLCPTGRIAVISFHSLEDRLVKQGLSDECGRCTCPPDFPVCVCGNKAKIKIITKKPILPGQTELSVNPRSRSAKLRVAEKL